MLLRLLEVALDHGDALDAGALLGGRISRTLPDLPLWEPAMTTTIVAAFDVKFLHVQRTSGASEMIFMKFFARSSRATGPKMRVPLGLPSASMMTIALLSKRR
jgi:hypothetical protein